MYVDLYLSGADRDRLNPLLDACVAVYVNDLDEDGQVDFKGKAKAFTRTYDFLSTILPYGVQDWGKPKGRQIRRFSVTRLNLEETHGNPSDGTALGLGHCKWKQELRGLSR